MHEPLWDQLLANARLPADAPRRERFNRYLDLLLLANERMNLTRITDRAAAEIHHVADALTVLPHLPPAERLSIADVGSGGGVPGVPLAIARPDCRVTLIESTKKKAAFLRDVARELAIDNLDVADGRAEDLAQSGRPLRESFDVVVARAVATMDWLVEWCLPLVRKGGKMLAMKGPKVSDELPTAARTIRLLGGGPAVVHAVELPGTEHRVIVEIPKVARTGARHPRTSTDAKGQPLS
jgi:16S rRNA (guanine527-N7)-methyltransferase